MRMKIKYDSNLCLRRHGTPDRSFMENLPKDLVMNRTYYFLKTGKREFFIEGKIPLRETDGNGNLSRPLANVRIPEYTHFLKDGEVYTRGEYVILEILSPMQQ